MNRMFVNLLCQDVSASAGFYEELLGMTRHFDSNWFVILTHPNMPGLEFGILERDNEVVPASVRAAPQGVIVTFVVEDVQAVFEKAQALGARVIQEPSVMFYGQTRLLVADPEGTVVDVSAPTATAVA